MDGFLTANSAEDKLRFRHNLIALRNMKNAFNSLSSDLTRLSYNGLFSSDSDLKAHHVFKNVPGIVVGRGSDDQRLNEHNVFFNAASDEDFFDHDSTQKLFYKELIDKASWGKSGSSHKAGAYLAEMIHVAFNGTQRAFNEIENEIKKAFSNVQVALLPYRDVILGDREPVYTTNGYVLARNAAARLGRHFMVAMGRQRPASGGAPGTTIEDDLVYDSSTVTAGLELPGSGSAHELDVAEKGRA